ncbi:MAG: chemotaxis protein, partial [Candidatus Sedimenticola endophacoides]
MVSGGLLISIIAALLTFWHVSTWDANDEAYLLRAAEQRVISQRIAKSALSAASGDRAAFAQLRTSRDDFQRLVDELKRGVPRIGLPPSPGEVGVPLREMENAWIELRQNADDILLSKEAVLSLREFISVVREFIPQLQELSGDVVNILIEDGAPGEQISTASRQLMLAERIDKNVARVLAGGQETATAIDQFSRDADLFSRILDGMLSGNPRMGVQQILDERATDKMKEVVVLFGSINDHATEIIEMVPEVLPAMEAANVITEVSDRVN